MPRLKAMPLKTDDPMQFYTEMRKLGQGASGTVFVGTDLRSGEVRICRAARDLWYGSVVYPVPSWARVRAPLAVAVAVAL